MDKDKAVKGEYAVTGAEIGTRLRRICLPNDYNVTTAGGVNSLLTEREKTHGDFTHGARVMQALKKVMMEGPNWSRLTDCQRETLHMYAHKIGRILVGDPNELDHWKDIMGYSQLVIDRIPVPASTVPKSVAGQPMDKPLAFERRYAQSSGFTSSLKGDPSSLKGGLSSDPPYLPFSQSQGETLQQAADRALKNYQEVNRPGTPEDGGHHAKEQREIKIYDSVKWKGMIWVVENITADGILHLTRRDYVFSSFVEKIP